MSTHSFCQVFSEAITNQFRGRRTLEDPCWCWENVDQRPPGRLLSFQPSSWSHLFLQTNNAAGQSPTPWSLWPLMLCMTLIPLRPQIPKMPFSKAKTPLAIALARVPNCLYLGVRGRTGHPTPHSRWAISTIMATPPSRPSTSKSDCNGDASLSSSGSTDTVAT